MDDRNVVEFLDKVSPHTIKKFELLSSYTDGWARKLLGYEKSSGIIFIDCMSNSGKYIDKNTGDIIDGTALLVTDFLERIAYKFPDKKVEIYFNDKEEQKIEILRKEILKKNYKNIEINFSVDDANNFLKNFKLRNELNISSLMIYDPYRADIDWEAINPFINRWGEVIINHMISDTIRGIGSATRLDTKHRYEKTYGNLERIVEEGIDKDKIEEIVIDIIKKQIKFDYRDFFIASFPFYNSKNTLVYNLIHCCHNIAGLKLFKNTVWKSFGGKSAFINDKQNPNQFSFGFYKEENSSNYIVNDIAKYLHKEFYGVGEVSFDEIYRRLDRHPIFPSDGFKSQIKKHLGSMQDVRVMQSKVIFGKVN